MSDKENDNQKMWVRVARTISEALPYMRRFSGQTFVIKYGGHAMGDADTLHNFCSDMVLLKQVGIHPVVVHGGGPQIGQMLERLQIKSNFIDGLRVTDAATMEVVEMVLAGTINKQLVAQIQQTGGTAVGLTGKDSNLLIAKPIRKTRKDPETGEEQEIDYGFVGDPETVNPQVLKLMESSSIIPVLAPIGVGKDGKSYNVNADTFAGAIAGALGAAKLIMLTDVAGVMDANKEYIKELGLDEVPKLIEEGVITGGMIPKVENCVYAVQAGCQSATILDGRVPHAVLIEVFTRHGMGTMVR